VRILNLVSLLVGVLSLVPIPYFLRKSIFGLFSSIYNLNLDEAEHEASYYSNFANFFTRNLKSNIRPIAKGFVVPADSQLIDAGQITDEVMLGIKGCRYSIKELIGSDIDSSRFKVGSFFNYYLAPGDYHHVHSPVSGKIVKRIYIPGNLYPVTKTFTKIFSDLYARQERVINIIKGQDDNLYCVILVGALNVGSISLEYDSNFRTNLLIRSKAKTITNFPNAFSIEAGQRLGTFYLGSTVVVLTDKVIDLQNLKVELGSKVKYGMEV
jgi:phosphatidylserine decarboxylase